jgi:hypothetical protein
MPKVNPPLKPAAAFGVAPGRRQHMDSDARAAGNTVAPDSGSVAGAAAFALLAYLWNVRLSLKQQWALLAGPAWLWATLAAIQTLDNANRPDDTSFMWITGIGMLALVFIIRRRIPRGLIYSVKVDKASPGQG